MLKVLIIHGYKSSPNSGWRPWLLGELAKLDVYACALPMPKPEEPSLNDWVKEITRLLERDPKDKYILVGHSLGVVAILKCLEENNVHGAVLVSGPIRSTKADLRHLFPESFDFEKIKGGSDNFVVIHGDNDQAVPYAQGQELAETLGCKLVTVEGGRHLNGSAGWTELPVVLEEIQKLLD